MTDDTRATRFAAALQQLEQSGDPDTLSELFAPEAELHRPELEHDAAGTSDARQFWAGYLAPFEQISTRFTEIVEVGNLAVLEWESQGRLVSDRPISYRGVSLLRFGADDRVVRFATYFDTAAFAPGTRSA